MGNREGGTGPGPTARAIGWTAALSDDSNLVVYLHGVWYSSFSKCSKHVRTGNALELLALLMCATGL